MRHVKYLIIGAGPSGLSFAAKLRENGEEDFFVLEKEDEAGGLCRSQTVDGAAFDIGGGHFLDVRNKEVLRFLFQYMPEEEWNLYTRDSRIRIGDMEIGHPFEANIWQMPVERQAEYLESISQAGCNRGIACPREFVEWIEWKLGERIAQDYMLPYNRKMFGENLQQLGTYWLEKLPDVSFRETLQSCLERKAYGKQPGHAQFYYPKTAGYGELWLRMAKTMSGRIVYNCAAAEIHIGENTVNGEYKADFIINTAPWTDVKLTGLPEVLSQKAARLKHTSVVTEYCPDDIDTDAHWIYMPEESLPYHRILVRKNFAGNARGYWTETNADRYRENGGIRFYSEYAYPLNTIDKPAVMKELLTYLSDKKIYGLGRWGEWSHYNSDVVVERAMGLADKLCDSNTLR